MRAGVSVMNQNLSFLSSLLLGQARAFPEDADSAKQAAKDVQQQKVPAVNVDLTAIQNLFSQIVRDIRSSADSISENSKAVTAEVLEQIRQELTKGQDAVDLSSLTSEYLTNAVMQTIARSGIPEESLQELRSAFQKLLDDMKVRDHDE